MRSFPSAKTVESKVVRRVRQMRYPLWKTRVSYSRTRDEPREFTAEERIGDYWERAFAFVEFHELYESVHDQVLAELDADISGTRVRKKNPNVSRSSKARLMARRMAGDCDIPQPRLRLLLIRLMRAEERLKSDQSQ